MAPMNVKRELNRRAWGRRVNLPRGPVLALWLGLGGLAVGLGAESTNQGWGSLRGTILDGDSGAPAPCNVRIVDAAGRTVLENESFKAGFRCDGRFTKRLPAGPTRLRVWRGLETGAQERLVDVPAGGETECQIRLERVVNLRARGWYAGDSHAHMLHGEKTIPVDFDFVALTAQAEDLRYLSLAQTWTLPVPSPENLEAALGGRSRPQTALTWNVELPKNYYRGDAGRCLGHCWTLGLRGRTPAGQDAIPLLTAASAHDYESDKPSFANFESHQVIHAQGGAVFYTHPARWWTGSWGGQGGYPKQERMRVSNMAVELPLDTLLGPTFDGVDVLTGSGEFRANTLAFELWCLLLNHGYRVAATASSDACFDRPGGAIPGDVRTYTRLAGEFSLPAVARATALGRTVATSGPLLVAALEGQPPGMAVSADGQSRALTLEGWACGQDAKGLTRWELLRNGRPVRTHLFSPPVRSFQTNLPLTETESAWYCVRLFGGDPQRQRAISGAFFFDPKPHHPPAPVPARVQITLLDAGTGQRLAGTATEVTFHATLANPGPKHPLPDGEGVVTIPGHVRLRAEAPGHRPLTLSPFLDHPELVEFITHLAAEDLVKWETFERIRTLLGQVKLTFRLERDSR